MLYRKKFKLLLDRLYFSHEDATFVEFFAEGNHLVRRKEIEAILKPSYDPAALRAVLALAAANGDKPVSVRRLSREFRALLSGDSRLIDTLNSRELVGNVLGFVRDRRYSAELRAFASGVLGKHSEGFYSDRGAVRSDPACNADDLRRLGVELDHALANGEKALAQSLLGIIAAYSRGSESARRRLLQLAADPPIDLVLRRELVRQLTLQQWPVFEDQGAFDLILGSISPDDLGTLELASSAVGSLGLSNGADPRVDRYVEKLVWVHGEIDDSTKEGRFAKEDLIHTFVTKDSLRVVPAIQEYLQSDVYSLESKKRALNTLVREASGEGFTRHQFKASHSALYAMLSRVWANTPAESELNPAIRGAMELFATLADSE